MDIMPRQDEPVSVNYPEDYDQSLNGIGGWLVLVIIGQIISIIYAIKSLFDCDRLMGLRPDVDTFIYFTIAFQIILGIGCSALILIFIFKRNIIFRTLYVIQVSVDFLFGIVTIIYFQGLGIDISSSMAPTLIGSILSMIIWISYLYKSKRIKNTYIYPKIY